MSTTWVATPAEPLRLVRAARWLLVLLHVPFVVVVGAYDYSAVTGTGARLAALAAPLPAVALSLRHCWAAADGHRPRHWPWTLLALAAASYLPLLWLSWAVASLQSLFMASVLILLRGWPAILLSAGPTLATAALVFPAERRAGSSAALAGVSTWIWLASFPAGAGSLWAATILVRRMKELYAARAALADLALSRERERVSRDLHDLLGQSLSAVSLKGDLAVKLLARDPATARSEVESLTELARSTLRDVRAITHGEHAVSLEQEITVAAELLGAAGIATHINVDLPSPSPPVRDILAWAVKEGTTNVLRHSEATTCSIDVRVAAGNARLVLENDGVRSGPPAAVSAGPTGSGLAGLAARTQELGGFASGKVVAGLGVGRFRLEVQLPVEAR